MTVESTARKQTFAGGQSALTFSFTTLVNHPEYIQVKNAVVATGVETDLVYSVDYTVSLLSDGTGGTVTLSPTFSTAFNHTVYRSTTDKQESDYDDFNQFPADTVEADLDRRTLISQERSEDLNRTAKLPISSSISSVILPIPVDGMSLVWLGTSGTLVNSSLTGSTGAIGPTGPTGPSGGSISLVTSSTSDITVVSISTTPIITAVNAATAGSNKILRLDSSGKLPALDASQLTLVLKNKFISTTRDVSATSGTVTISGVGFTPRAVIVWAAINGGKQMSFGIIDSTASGDGICTSDGAAADTWATGEGHIAIEIDGSNKATAVISSFNSDGCVLTWTKTGTPTGTAFIKMLFLA